MKKNNLYNCKQRYRGSIRCFHFLRLLQTNQQVENLNISETPKISQRILNHWDNLYRTVERGYAGFSLWNWHKLPDYYIDHRYKEYVWDGFIMVAKSLCSIVQTANT